MMIIGDRLNRRECMVLLNVSHGRFKDLLDAGAIPPDVGMGPKSLRWARADIEPLLVARRAARSLLAVVTAHGP